MDNEMKITCFTDIKDSTKLTEQLGHDKFNLIRNNYFAVCEALVQRNRGKVIKNTGDGHLILFSDIESGFNFAAQIQQYYQPQPNFKKDPISLRIGLCLGVVTVAQSDVFGSGVNQTARVEATSSPGEIRINDELYKALIPVWGQTKVNALFIKEGEITLKGVEHPVMLYTFKWLEYVKEYYDKSLSELVTQQLHSASVVLHNLSTKDLASQPTIIWPVVPRNDVNAIHCGQLEIIRLLAMLGSHLQVLIADCGMTNNPTKEYSDQFKEKIKQHAEKRGITDISFSLMSEMLKPGCEGCQIFHTHFQNVVTSMSLETMQNIVYKDYADLDKTRIQKETTLNFLRPALTISLVLNLSDKVNEKCIVIAGYDEKDQWDKAHNFIQGAPPRFGVLFNPILKGKEGHQGRQTGNSFRYFSSQGILEDMGRHYLATWLVKLPLFLSQFPSQKVTIADKQIYPDDWSNDKDIEGQINKEQLAQDIFNLILNVE